MKISKAVEQIKAQHNVQYAESLVVIEDIVIVGIVFKSSESMHEFLFAWCSAIRKKTEQNFSITTKYFEQEGELSSFSACYQPHDASCGIDEVSFGEQRLSN